MAHSTRDILRRLGAGESIASVCRWLGWTEAAFDGWWRRETQCRAPQRGREALRAVTGMVAIERDHWGIPRIEADRADDAWYGFGYAMAQDRLFQMDYLRRKAMGRLAEVLGPEGLAHDRVARTIGLNRIARDEMARLPEDTSRFLDWFSQGVNAWIGQAAELIPIEFDLLAYRPEPWTPLASVAIENEFRWYLTGRFPVICMPELAKRVLGEGPLYHEFCTGEADEEAIVPPEAYAELRRREENARGAGSAALPPEAVGQVMGAGDGTGSNNWVVAGRHTRSGKPMVASDPHIALEAVSCWYEAQIIAGDIRVAGTAYVGMPAIIIGRTETVAWGITNNICSQRDLYQERTDPAYPDCFLYDGRWEPVRRTTEVIQVRDAASETVEVRFSRNGPVVDALLPPPADRTGPVTVRWLGAHEGGWLTALLGMNRARTVAEFRESVRPWHVPTFNLVVADVAGTIAVQSTGRIPVRKSAERGYRPGWDPDHQWQGLLPFEAMPHAVDPPRGWLVSANNRLAAADYPYPLFGTWISGYRAQRIRQLIEACLERDAAAGTPAGITLDDFRVMQHDTLSLRAVECVPPLVTLLQHDSDPRVREALECLRSWDRRIEADHVGPTLFNAFFTRWSRAVSDARFTGATAELLARQTDVIAGRLLVADPHGWFAEGTRTAAIRQAFQETLAELSERLGGAVSEWTWGRLHRMPLRHVLSERGDLGRLLDHGGGPVKGDMITVCNTGSGPEWIANTGAGYRFIADLGSDRIWAVDGQSQSGHAGTPHYDDQLSAWEIGEYHSQSLRRPED